MSQLLLFLTILSYLGLSRAETRPHGIEFESPIAFSPDAYAFFHPAALSPGPAAAQSKRLPLAATVQSTPAQESTAQSSRHGLGPAGVVGLSLSLTFVCLVGMGVYYVLTRRRAHLHQAINDPKQPANV
ncbi:NSP-interacting kinase 2 [Striga asiatica]|uniref:NSP-interacting kinase 2 n=1 Tax=Striga asiatica TaxID=4170 RepID=A0A5A7PPU7_STRAF|nr:NSP-interacting kinase 2 [Striga asiatica]